MAKVILICGKICSGKTYYSNKIRKQLNAVLLSCDEIEYEIFHHSLGSNHDKVAEDIQKYLFNKSVDIISIGANVILDWGFWTREDRLKASRFYKEHNIKFEWHYVNISDEGWKRNISARNKAVENNETTDYYVDKGLLTKLISKFEYPTKDEFEFLISDCEKKFDSE